MDYTRFGILRENIPDLQRISPFQTQGPFAVNVRVDVSITDDPPQHSARLAILHGDITVYCEGVAEVTGNSIRFGIVLSTSGYERARNREFKTPVRISWKLMAVKDKIFHEIGTKTRFLRIPKDHLLSHSDDFIEVNVSDLDNELFVGSVVEFKWIVKVEWHRWEDINDDDNDGVNKKLILVLHHLADMMDTEFNKQT